MKATGVDYSSKIRLKKLAEEGYSAEEISSDIQVKIESVESWMKYFDFDPNQGRPDAVVTELEEEEEEDD